MKRVWAVAGATVAMVVGLASPAFACGGLIGPNGAVNLLRTTTLAGYHNGVEHYVTSFEFAGGGGAFGSLVPLPGVPTKVERGGDWTLQRLIRETTPVFAAGGALDAAPRAATLASAEVLLTAKVDALDITVLRGGGAAVGKWATDHGFRLPPDAPQVLDFYAQRSQIFLAAAFDANRAKKFKQGVGDGTPVHITIPTANPWVPLRILALGKKAAEPVQADVYLLTDDKPALLSTSPIGTSDGFEQTTTLSVTYDQSASPQLLRDLRTDKNGSWVPHVGWLTKVSVNGPAASVTGDLAIDASGKNLPSARLAGYALGPNGPAPFAPASDDSPLPAIAVASMVAVLLVLWVAGAAKARRTA